jgi:hypothetical protein
MSLPRPPVQRSRFDVQNLIGRDFDPDDRFRPFQEKIYPTLLAAREELAACYCADNGRPAEEPVMLLEMPRGSGNAKGVGVLPIGTIPDPLCMAYRNHS